MSSVQPSPRETLSITKFLESYSRFDPDKGCYESWNDSVDRVMNMHRKYYLEKLDQSELVDMISFVEKMYKDKLAFGAQRALQFGGDQMLKHHMRMYNCVSTYIDRTEVFGEILYLLLCGCGAGFSVQKHHVDKLPKIIKRSKSPKVYKPEDSIEGWADCIDVLMSSYFDTNGKYPEYRAHKVFFDLSSIRSKGSPISGGFSAPGPDPLWKALNLASNILDDAKDRKLRPIEVYDILMHMSDSVLAGGVRRSATIAMFSVDDDEMMNSKTGNWFSENPQRARSNNSAMLLRDSVSKEQFTELLKRTEQFGEPGFIWTDSLEFTYNPCVEIGKYPVWIDEEGKSHSGIQACNLTEINGIYCDTEEKFYEACKAASILGTLQAGYTKFKFVSDVTKKIIERESLIGVSITGFVNNPEILFNPEILKNGAKIVLEWNKKTAKLIGINPSPRTTCVKPSGNLSVLAGSASGIHAEHSKRYFRTIEMNKDHEISKVFATYNPIAVEESIYSSSRTDLKLYFPIENKDGTIFKEEFYNTGLLEKVKLVQSSWVEYGTDESLATDSRVRHNVSNTVSVTSDGWSIVGDYIYENRRYLTGVSLIGTTGDKDYFQAPNIGVKSLEELISEYSHAAMFAPGLIVAGLDHFPNLWDAIRYATTENSNLSKSESSTVDAMRSNWKSRFIKFASRYLNGDMIKTSYCLKDAYLYHKWVRITQEFNPISEQDYQQVLVTQRMIDADTLAAASCSGGACEI